MRAAAASQAFDKAGLFDEETGFNSIGREASVPRPQAEDRQDTCRFDALMLNESLSAQTDEKLFHFCKAERGWRSGAALTEQDNTVAKKNEPVKA